MEFSKKKSSVTSVTVNSTCSSESHSYDTFKARVNLLLLLPLLGNVSLICCGTVSIHHQRVVMLHLCVPSQTCLAYKLLRALLAISTFLCFVIMRYDSLPGLLKVLSPLPVFSPPSRALSEFNCLLSSASSTSHANYLKNWFCSKQVSSLSLSNCTICRHQSETVLTQCTIGWVGISLVSCGVVNIVNFSPGSCGFNVNTVST